MPDLIPADDEVASFVPLVTIPEDEPQEVGSPRDQIDTELDPRHREDFVGLLYLGKVDHEVTVAGHRFLLATPGQRDRLEMGPLHKGYVNTITGERAWMAVTVAAYLRRIDNEDAPEPLTRAKSPLVTRYEWVLNSIHSEVVIEKLYGKCMELDARVRDLTEELDELGKA
jgi:hypothetical protein